MTPPGPPGGPGAPWNRDEYMPRSRSRTTVGGSVRGATSSRSATRAVRRTTSQRSTAAVSRPAARTRPAPVVRSTRPVPSVPIDPMPRVRRRSTIGPWLRDIDSFGEFGRKLATSTGRAIWATVAGVFGDAVSIQGSGPVAVRAGSPRRRLLVVLTAVVLALVIILWQVLQLQVVDRQRYVAYGASLRNTTQVLAADRGSILDRNGAQMVISRPARSVFVDPKLITDPAAESVQLASVLGLDASVVRTKMSGEGRFAYIARKVNDDTVAAVQALGLPGVAFLDESERFLTAGDSARSLLGSVDVDNVGIAGLESQYSDLLTGTPGRISLERSPSGRTIAAGDHSVTPAVKGDDLKLTIDRSIQFEAERLLGDQVKASGAKGGVAIVSRPNTGEVLAIANMVTDPDTGQVRVSTNNFALTTQYEPGSVMKMVTIAGALEAGLVNPTTQLTLPPTLQVYDAEYGEAEGRGTVTWDVTQILTHSSNIGSIKIGQSLGKDALYATQRAFGLGVRTALDFPNEAPGSVLAPSKYVGTSLPSISIGQGIAVTPMQLLFAFNAIANQGVYVAPKLVDSTIDAQGVTHPTAVSDSHRAISSATADKLNLMLRSVVNEGTGQLAAINGYAVAGKTGTARKPQAGGGYTDKLGVTRYQSTFVGFVPAQQPALSVYVMLDEPGGDYTGGATAAPVFSKLGSFALNRLGIAPAATDIALGGAPVNAVIGAPTPSTQAIITDGDRVRALTAGSPEALAAATVTTLPPPPTTTTTTRRSTVTTR